MLIQIRVRIPAFNNTKQHQILFSLIFDNLKGQCHEIFDLYIFSLIEPIWAPDKQAEMVFL